MPMINFNSVRQIYQGGRQIKRLYAGGQLVWKEPRIVTGTFFYSVTKMSSTDKTNVIVFTPSFEALKIKASDVAYYVGKTGKWYPITLNHAISSTILNIPFEEFTGTYSSSQHTLVLKDTD